MSKRLRPSVWTRLLPPPPALPPAGDAGGACAMPGGLDPVAATQRHGWQSASVWMLGLWGVGALANEAVASLGLAGCAFLVGFDLLCSNQSVEPLQRRLMRWWPLLAWAFWAIASPLFAGRTPSGTGVARVADWLALPCAAYLWGRLPERPRARLGLIWAAVFVIPAPSRDCSRSGSGPRRGSSSTSPGCDCRSLGSMSPRPRRAASWEGACCFIG